MDHPDKLIPLQCKVEGEQLVIRIGVGTLAWAAQHCPLLYDNAKHKGSGPYVGIDNEHELAIDVCRELNAEEEDGTTPVHRLLDRAIFDAFENGSTGFSDEDDQ